MKNLRFISLVAKFWKNTDEKPYSQFVYYNKNLASAVICDLQNEKTSINIIDGKRCSFEEAVDQLYTWALQRHDLEIYRADDLVAARPLLEKRKQDLEKARVDEEMLRRDLGMGNKVISLPMRPVNQKDTSGKDLPELSDN